MKLFNRLLKGNKYNAVSITIDEADAVARLCYLLNYREEYNQLLSLYNEEDKKRQIIAELFVFKQWVIQWLYHLYTPAAIWESMLKEILSSGQTVGIKYLLSIDGINIEKFWGESYGKIVREAFSTYDKIYGKKLVAELPGDKVLDELQFRISFGEDAMHNAGVRRLLIIDLNYLM